MKKKSSAKKPLQIKFWFNAVRDSLESFEMEDVDTMTETVVKATEYYASVVEDAQPHLTGFGELTTMVAQTPGLLGLYNSVYVDAQQVRLWLEMVHEQRDSDRYVYFKSDPQAKADYGEMKNVADIKNFVKADVVLNTIGDVIRIVANSQHQLENVVERLTNRSMSLSKLVDMKVAGIDELWIDPPSIKATKEDKVVVVHD
jgi:hypothetical protein